MRLRSVVRVSVSAIFRNKVRSLLTSLGIIIGVASVILLVSIGNGIQNYITSAFQDLGSNLLFVIPGKTNFNGRGGGPPGTATNKLTLHLADTLVARAEHVDSVVPVITTSLTTKYKANTHVSSVLGTSAEYQDVNNTHASQGSFFTKSEVSRAAKVAVVGSTVVDKLFDGLSPIGKDISVGDIRYKVIGVLNSKGSAFGNDQDDQIIVPITTIQRQLNTDKLNAIYVRIDSTDNIDIAKRAIEKALLKDLKEDDFSVNDPKELLSTIQGILGVITLALGGIAAISLLVGGIGIMNIMLVSVTERTREIGLRKAVGARPSDILTQFLIEAILLSVTGGIIGILLGSLGSLILSRFVYTTVTLWSVALAFGFASLVGVVFGVWPARKASKLSPIEALRYE